MSALPRIEEAFAHLDRPQHTRIVHLGLGNFHRAHQAWYTAHAPDASEWGIAAFTGRRRDAADVLSRQHGLYSLVTRAPAGDSTDVIPSITRAISGSDLDAMIALVRSPEIAIVTLTITEAGYVEPGATDNSDPAPSPAASELTALERLVYALDARRRSDGGPIALVPCDNLPENGAVLGARIRELAGRRAPKLLAWLDDNASFVSTSVDRITPRALPGSAIVDGVATDDAQVVAEPFSDWILEGDFPAGRPAWEAAGARFVDDVAPWENRKLWLLNGAHSILAAAGQRRRLETVAEAIAHPECRELVDAFWAEAGLLLPETVEPQRYCERLVERFSNARIEHRLTQIAEGSAAKFEYRVAAVAERLRERGHGATGCAIAIAEWIAQGGPGERSVAAVSRDLAADASFSTRVSDAVHRLRS